IPTISSQTIPPWSCTPSSSATRPHSQTPKILALTIQAIASHSGNICSAGTNTKPAKVPQVPGAFLAKPEPKPKAKKCQKLRQTLWACMGRVFLNKNADNHCADASPCVLRCQTAALLLQHRPDQSPVPLEITAAKVQPVAVQC